MLADEEEEDDDDDEVGEVLTLPLQAHHAMEKMEEFVHKVSVTFPTFGNSTRQRTTLGKYAQGRVEHYKAVERDCCLRVKIK